VYINRNSFFSNIFHLSAFRKLTKSTVSRKRDHMTIFYMVTQCSSFCVKSVFRTTMFCFLIEKNTVMFAYEFRFQDMYSQILLPLVILDTFNRTNRLLRRTFQNIRILIRVQRLTVSQLECYDQCIRSIYFYNILF
jgi:hypothetical protein